MRCRWPALNGALAPELRTPAQTTANLVNLTLTGLSDSGGADEVTMSWGGGGNLRSAPGNNLFNLTQDWKFAEFNVFGDGNGTQANFRNGTTIVVKTSVDDGTTNAPSCPQNSYTGETNNLTLVPLCCPYGGASPAIEFMQGNAGHTATCGATALIGDPHLATADGAHYDFQGAGEFVSLRDPDGGEIQTRQTPIATTFFPGPDPHDGLATCVSINTAVAARVGKRRVTYEPNLNGIPDPNGLQLRIDGALAILAGQGLNLWKRRSRDPVPGRRRSSG